MNRAPKIRRKRGGGGRWVLTLLLAATAACEAGGPGSRASYQLRDSAGVEIVENREPRWGAGEGWRVGPEPLLRIGVVEGEEVFQFSRIIGLVRLGDGGVAVGDGLSNQVRFFDADGAHITTVGQTGAGPGEFTGLSGLGRAGPSSLWAYDFSLRRITWMDDAGDVTGTTSLGPEPAMLHPVGVLADGTFLLKQLWGAEATARTSDTGLRRDLIALVRFDSAGSLVDTLGLVPGRELYIVEEDGRGVMGTPPFGKHNVTTLSLGGVVVGSGDEYSIEEIDSQGRLLRIVRIPGREQEVGPAEMEAFIRGRLEGVPAEDHARVRGSILDLPHSPTVPPYGGMLTDAGGNLWVSEWVPSGKLPESWDVFDVTGAWMGTVRMPDGFLPYVVGAERILGVETDAMDVEYVLDYPLHRG